MAFNAVSVLQKVYEAMQHSPVGHHSSLQRVKGEHRQQMPTSAAQADLEDLQVSPPLYIAAMQLVWHSTSSTQRWGAAVCVRLLELKRCRAQHPVSPVHFKHQGWSRSEAPACAKQLPRCAALTSAVAGPLLLMALCLYADQRTDGLWWQRPSTERCLAREVGRGAAAPGAESY